MEKNLIGQRLRMARFRGKPPVTQRDLLAWLEVKGLHLSESAISKIEANTRPVTDMELVAIAEILKVDILWLLHKDKD